MCPPSGRTASGGGHQDGVCSCSYPPRRVWLSFARLPTTAGHLIICTYCARLYNWHTMFSPFLPWPALHCGCRQAQCKGVKQNLAEQCFTRCSPTPGAKRVGSDAISGGACLIRLNTPARRQSQTSALPPHLGSSVQLPKIMVCITKVQGPRLALSHGLAPVRAHAGGAPGALCGLPLKSHRQCGLGGVGGWDCGLGKWGTASGKERGWCIEPVGNEQ
jgi:hypothetical protein